MLSLIVAILFGLGITYFAFQNAVGVPVNFAGYHLAGIPLFYVVVTALVSGILMAWVISAVNGMSSFMKIRGKDSIIEKDKKEINNLKSKIKDLEDENARLKNRKEEVVAKRHDEVHEYRNATPFFSRLLRPQI